MRSQLTRSIIREEGLEGKSAYITVALHSRWIGRPGRFAALKRMIEHFTSFDDVWFATREQIARHWKETYPYVPKKSVTNGH
jgi:peptidoglycan/xylan/chitin deacetylase (PgdA/CDA1 family)